MVLTILNKVLWGLLWLKCEVKLPVSIWYHAIVLECSNSGPLFNATEESLVIRFMFQSQHNHPWSSELVEDALVTQCLLKSSLTSILFSFAVGVFAEKRISGFCRGGYMVRRGGLPSHLISDWWWGQGAACMGWCRWCSPLLVSSSSWVYCTRWLGEPSMAYLLGGYGYSILIGHFG